MHLLFDLDGTLIDSLPGIAASLNHALSAHELPTHPLDAVRNFVGDGAFTTARRAIPAKEPDALAHRIEAAFKRHYADHWSDGTTLYPGIEALLGELRSGQHQLAVVSNKPHPFTVAICDRLFPAGTFDLVVGQSDDLNKKPAPDMALKALNSWGIPPKDALFIGDSTVDRDTAANAGIPFLAVGWGYHDPDRLGAKIAMDADSLRHLIGLV